MSAEIINIIAPVFIVAAIGFFLERSGKGFQPETLSRLAIRLGTPALVFSSLTNTALPDDSLVRVVGITFAAALVGGILASTVLIASRLSLRTFVSSLALPNAGNAGLPIVFFAFAEDGLTIGAAFFFAIALVQYTVVPAIVTGDPGLRKLLAEPLVWAIVAVIVVRLTDIAVPEMIADTTALLGGMMIPVMLILLGGALARLKVGDIRTSFALALARLAIGTATGLILVFAFSLTGVEAGTIFLMSAMPSALITYVIAEHYGRDPEKVAGLVVGSTLLNFACLPFLIAAAIRLSAS